MGCRQAVRLRTLTPSSGSSNLSTPAMSNGQNRSGREKTRKTEISRDFSVFFDPNFFRIFIDPFSIFFRVEGFELPKTQFFQNFITNESNTKDLNPRQGLGLFRFFVLVTKCLQIVYYKTRPSLLQEDLNPRKAEKCVFRNRSICHIKGLEPANHKNRPAEAKEKSHGNKTVANSIRVQLSDKLEFDIHFLGTDCFMYSI